MDYPNKLYKKGVFYRRLGYSVVPVYGHHSPTRPKAAAVRWADYQKRPPTVEELDDWFLKRQFGGMAIVCGEVSQLAVLDFDDPELAARFAVLHPQLTDTFTVLSGQRGLPHYYFHVPSGLTTRSRSIKGVDWQYNGRYVIAPPTTFEDASWRVASDVLPRTLNQNDLEWIMTFLDEQTTQYPSETPAVNIPQVPDRITQLSLSLELTPERVTHHYLSQVHLGRNNALFATCCWVRDCGGTVDQASVLVRIHASQPAYGYHMPESMDKRRGEALRTIQSAFSRPSGFRAGYRYRFIPNSLREHLLQHKQTALLRVLEVVVKAGWRAGKQFTRAMLLKACAPFQIGDWSIRKALAARTPQKKTVFEEVATAAFAAKVSGDIPPQLNAIELRATEPTQNRGRPARCYVMPDLRDLCFEFDVEWSAGDAIADADLQTVATYRRTLHQRLIQRRPGQYHRGWLANRLGVSVRTLNRYNNHLNMTLTPVYKRRFITWRTLGHMPDDLREHQMGAFLEDESGKRYPPLLPIARRLLRNKHQVVFHQRMANRYELPVPVDIAVPDTTAAIQSPSSTLASFAAQSSSVHSVPEPVPVEPQPLNESIQQPERDLSDHEKAVVSKLCAAANHTLATHRAESLVREYGRFALQDALETVQARGESIKNPAAFIVSLLKARYGHSNHLSNNAVALAESLYLAVEWHSPDHRVRWQKCLDLIAEYGESCIGDLVCHLNAVPRGTLKNAAGYVVKKLREQTESTYAKHDANLIMQLVNTTRSINPQHAFSNAAAAKLTEHYGNSAVEFALSVMKSRSNIVNPAGFVVSFLKSNAKR